MRKATLICFLGLLLFPITGAAAPSAEADAAIARGISFRREGNDAAALEQFRRAREIEGTPRASAQIGLALQALGQWVDAEVELQEALQHSSDPWLAQNRVVLETSLKKVRAHLGTLQIVGSPAGAEVFVERRRVGVLPLATPIRATSGTVAIEVRAPGFLPVLRNVSISSMQESREVVDLTPLTGMTNPSREGVDGPRPLPDQMIIDHRASSDVEQGRASSRRTVAWVAAGTGIGLLAGGFLALVKRGNKDDALSMHINVDKSCVQMGDGFLGPAAQDCATLANSRETWTWISGATFAGATVSAAIAIIMWQMPGSNAAKTASSVYAPNVQVAGGQNAAVISVGWRR